MATQLDCRARRHDLTDRECASLLGGCIGALLLSADHLAVQRAVKWWAERKDVEWYDLAAQAEGAQNSLTPFRRGDGPRTEIIEDL